LQFRPHVQLYVDDILVMTDNVEQHMDLLENLFRKFQEFNITINFNKSQFFKAELEYVGYILTPRGIKPPVLDGLGNRTTG
ncbi:reverse transcriptase domain-containing protein, partial [Klebsiella pneumoniae]|uniref:reverse transcriptase domain-containing protein n=1 Tax=Klebsiella pneumoniae TaxID=573 RepID=UPI0040557D92